ncbi:MAG: hypothetical protein IIB76_11955 [Proteobacteria bacterium]|nr:hypothetical protein [Pseudomonadota bacterium]
MEPLREIGALSPELRTAELAATNQARFNEIAATELTALHEGNIARYRLRPPEYREWRESWQ